MVFIVTDAVIWAAALPMLIAALLGSYAGGRLNRMPPGRAARRVVSSMDPFITVFFALCYRTRVATVYHHSQNRPDVANRANV